LRRPSAQSALSVLLSFAVFADFQPLDDRAPSTIEVEESRKTARS
jgi:hypothetical protein